MSVQGPLDPELRQLKANVAHRMRREAADLRAEAHTKELRASVIERTWKLFPQTGDEPDLRDGFWDKVEE